MCWSTYRAAYRPARAERPATPGMRIGDAERDETISALSRHTGEGRLTLDEFEERVDEVLQARTHADLRHALRELPEPVRPQVVPARHPVVADRRLLLRVIVAVAAILVFGWWVAWLAIPILIMRSRRHHHHHRGDWSHPRDDELTLI